jgi:large conductance mechanosensitive channel
LKLKVPKTVNLSVGDLDRLTLAQAKEMGISVLPYGSFLSMAIEFLIVAFCVFLLVKAINVMKKRFEEQPVVASPTPSAPSNEEKLLEEIRDLLKAKHD